MQSRGEHPERPNKVNCAARFFEAQHRHRASSAFLLLMTLFFPTRVAATLHGDSPRGVGAGVPRNSTAS
jgi:hypothetical protein